MAQLILLCNTSTLYTFSGVAAKRGCHILDKDLKKLKGGCLLIGQGKVLWTGTSRGLESAKFLALTRGKSLKVIDLKGQSIMPAFVECHTHLIFSGDRKNEFELRNKGVSYAQIAQQGGGIISTVKATRKASEADLLKSAQKRAHRFMAQGVATLEVKSGYGLSKIAEIKMLKVASKLKGPQVIKTFLGLHALPPEYKNINQYVQDTISKTLSAIKPWADRVDIFIEEGYFSSKHAIQLYEACRALGLSMVAHCDQLTNNGGGLLAAKHGFQSADHLVQMTSSQIEQFSKESKTVAVLLPTADFYLKMAYPNARHFIDSGACVALATDFNPGSSPSQDISLVGVLARLQMKMSLAEVFAAYTYNAARSLGLENEIGTLEVGKSANFCVFAGDLEDFFFEVGVHPVRETWKNGQRIFKKASLEE